MIGALVQEADRRASGKRRARPGSLEELTRGAGAPPAGGGRAEITVRGDYAPTK